MGSEECVSNPPSNSKRMGSSILIRRKKAFLNMQKTVAIFRQERKYSPYPGGTDVTIT
jgi:hypothetical protein